MGAASTPLEELSREELIERIRVLEALVAEQRAEIERLKREGRRQAAPFSKGKRKAAPKRPGRKPGEGRFTYRTRPDPSELTEPPVDVPLARTACPACGGALEEVGVDLCWRTELPPLPRPEVREYRVRVARCTHCGKRVRARHPEVAEDQVGASAHRLGPRLLAAADVLHYGVGVPLRRVPPLLAELWGVRVTQGALTQAALRQAKGNALLCYEALRSEVAGSAVCHTDPTGWRVGGESAQLAVFQTEAATLYTIGPTHTNEDVRGVIGNAYPGVLVTDRASRYDALCPPGRASAEVPRPCAPKPLRGERDEAGQRQSFLRVAGEAPASGAPALDHAAGGRDHGTGVPPPRRAHPARTDAPAP